MVERWLRGTTTAMMSKQSEDAVGPRVRQQTTGGIPQRGTAGAVWCRHLYTRTASLNSIRSGTFSHCGTEGPKEDGTNNTIRCIQGGQKATIDQLIDRDKFVEHRPQHVDVGA